MEQGKLLERARLGKFWTQRQAAEALGVSVPTLIRWEKGISDPFPVNMEKICSVYGLSPEQLGVAYSPTMQQSPIEDPPILFAEQDLSLRLMRLVWRHRPRDASYYDLQLQVTQELHLHDPTRRDALRRLALLPIEMSGLSIVNVVLKAPEPEVLAGCAAGLSACWALRKGRDLAFISQIVSKYIPTLRLIAGQSSAYRHAAADLLAQCYLMKGLLAWHVEGHAASIKYAERAASHASEAGNATMHILALRTRAAAHYYANQWQHALHTAEQAQHALETAKDAAIPTMARSYVYAGLATYQAQFQQKQEALRSLGKAREFFFKQDPDECVPAWIDHYLGNLVLNDGQTHFHLGMQKEALDSFAQIHADPDGSEAIRIEASLAQALAEAFRADSRDMDWCIDRWTQGIEGAKALKSEQRFGEALQAYAAMCAAWPTEARINALRERIVYW